MFLFNSVSIVGVGLLGGSLALEIKKRKLAQIVKGFSRQKESAHWALRHKIVDRCSTDLGIVKDSDLVILAVPVGNIVEIALKIKGMISDDCIVTDVGSTKEQMVKKLEKIFPGYVGSHPLAGSEKRGVQNARLGIFNKSVCILTPTKKTNAQSLSVMRSFWEHLGCRVVLMSPRQHDRVLSWASHLPHIAAFGLAKIFPQKYSLFASGGFKDTTRIAASDSRLWRDIFLSNSENVCSAIESYQKELSRLKQLVRSKDDSKLLSFLKEAQRKRLYLEGYNS